MVKSYNKPLLQKNDLLEMEHMLIMADSGEFNACPTCQFGVDVKSSKNPKCQACKNIMLGNISRYDFCGQK